MEGYEPDSKYLTLWICVVVAAGIILFGWAFSMKYSFSKINNEMHSSVGKTSDQAAEEMFQMFEAVDQALKQQESEVELEAVTIDEQVSEDLEQATETMKQEIAKDLESDTTE